MKHATVVKLILLPPLAGAILLGYWIASGRMSRLFSALAGRGAVYEMLAARPDPPEPSSPPAAALPDDSAAFTAVEALAVRDLLWFGHSDSLDARFADYTARARGDVAAEDLLYDAYDVSFAAVDDRFGPSLDDWVTARPDSRYARLARAAWQVNVARSRRGTASARNTPRQSFVAMETALKQALADLAVAIRVDSSDIAGYWIAMNVAQLRGDRRGHRLALRRALILSPASAFTRARAMMGLLPRWGGSYAAMDSLARDAMRYAATNPQLGSLAGFVHWDRANARWPRGDTTSRLAHLDSAMASGPNYWFCLDRGRQDLQLDHYDLALADLSCARSARPARVEPHYLLALTFWNVSGRGGIEGYNAFHWALDEMHTAMALDSSDADQRRQAHELESAARGGQR